MFMIAGVFMAVAVAMLFTDLGLYGILFVFLLVYVFPTLLFGHFQ
jgi:hypothetical protein